ESHFQFVNRFGRDARDEDLVEPFEGIVITLQPANTFLDGQTGRHRLIHGANSGESRQISIGLVGVHINNPGQLASDCRNSTPISLWRRKGRGFENPLIAMFGESIRKNSTQPRMDTNEHEYRQSDEAPEPPESPAAERLGPPIAFVSP